MKTKKILKALKFRATPTNSQKRRLRRFGGCCRKVYNWGLAERKRVYEETGKGLSYNNQAASLVDYKKQFGFLKETPSQALQASLKNLDKAYSNFFKHLADFPTFKKKSYGNDTIHFPQGNLLEVTQLSKKKSKIKLPKLGSLKFISHREVQGELKSATISMEAGNFYLSILVDQEVLYPSLGALGLDLGISRSIATSENVFYDLPMLKIKTLETKIKTLQRKRSRVEKYSEKYYRLLRSERKLSRKITNLRHDFLHKISCFLAKNHEILCMEDLKIKCMSKSARGTLEDPGKEVRKKTNLNRATLRQGWGIFRRLLEYKTVWYGSKLVVVNPMNTSRQCRVCGFTTASNRKTQEEFSCLYCGHEENADFNAAKNIRRLGLESYGFTSSFAAGAVQDAPAIAAFLGA